MTSERTGPPRHVGDPAPVTKLYYRRKAVVVTNRYLRVGRRTYDIAELADLMQRRQGLRNQRPVTGAVTIAAAAVLAVVFVTSFSLPSTWFAATTALVIACATLAVGAALRRPRQLELLATYRGRKMSLLSSHDPREFGRIVRAVRRAMDAAADAAAVDQ